MGIYGFALCERLRSPLLYAGYLALQIPLSGVIIYLSRGLAYLVAMPLAGQAVALAREIHDTLGHYLTAINVQLEAARALLDGDRERSRATP
jgi:hypothetical protein